VPGNGRTMAVHERKAKAKDKPTLTILNVLKREAVTENELYADGREYTSIVLIPIPQTTEDE
jgi:hypothetical protein